MSVVRHQDAPVMPLGPSLLAPHLRHLVRDLNLCLHSDRFLIAVEPGVSHELTHTVFIFFCNLN